jgi:hypothetical protein
MWTTAFAFGAFWGPTVSGVLYDNFGFRDSTYFVILLECLVATMYLSFAWYDKRNRRLSDGSEFDNCSSLVEKDETSLLIPKSNGIQQI